MNLTHFTNAETLKPYSVEQSPRDGMKPTGLWVSVDGEHDWPWWCASEQFRDTDAQRRYRVTLAESGGPLVLSSVADLDAFAATYGDSEDMGLIAWSRVAALWRGIIITPYQWSRRYNGGLWYYGWDCASGCIWDASAIASVELLDAEVLR